jgi:hypothetical protein
VVNLINKLFDRTSTEEFLKNDINFWNFLLQNFLKGKVESQGQVLNTFADPNLGLTSFYSKTAQNMFII